MWDPGFSWQWEFVLCTFLRFLCHTEQEDLVAGFLFFKVSFCGVFKDLGMGISVRSTQLPGCTGTTLICTAK